MLRIDVTFFRSVGVYALVIMAAVSLNVDHARADMITVINSSFEDISGETPFNEFTFGPLNGWDLYDPSNITAGGAGGTYFIGTLTPTAPVFFNSGASDGSRVAIAFNFFGSGGQGEYGMVQTLNETLQANRTYTLQVDIGNIASGTGNNAVFFPLDGFPGYRVDLLAGGQVIASDNNSLAGIIPEGGFMASQFQFTADPTHALIGQALGIRLVNRNVIDPAFPNSDLEVDFDNVRLSVVSAVPEPASMLLFASVLGLFHFARSIKTRRVNGVDLRVYSNETQSPPAAGR